MAAHIDDKLSKFLKQTAVNSRNDLCLLYTLKLKHQEFWPYDNPGSYYRDNIANFFEHNHQTCEKIIRETAYGLINKTEFSWITNERRQLEWLKREILRLHFSDFNDARYSHAVINTPTNKETVVAIFDALGGNNNSKSLVLDSLRTNWKRHKDFDKNYRWFKDNAEKCTFASQWLKSNKNFQALTPFETYEDLVIFFDQSGLANDTKELYIGKIKNTWNQKNYKAKLEGKSQCNLILSNTIIGSLKKLSDKYGVSRARIVEILIEMETNKGVYIKSKVEEMKLLDHDAFLSLLDKHTSDQ